MKKILLHSIIMNIMNYWSWDWGDMVVQQGTLEFIVNHVSH